MHQIGCSKEVDRRNGVCVCVRRGVVQSFTLYTSFICLAVSGLSCSTRDP